MTATTSFLLDGDHGPLHGLLDLPAGPGPHPTVVAVHGFKGFMEWGFFPPLAELLAARGFAVVRINLSGSGMLPGEELAGNLDAFRDNTHRRELDDVERVLAAVGDEIGPGRVDPDRLGLLGHSRGGGAVLLAASRDPWRQQLKALVTWAAVARYDRYPEPMIRQWRAEGETIVVNGRTGQELPLGRALLEELESRPPELDLPAAASRRTAPWLVLHGSEDEAVPVEEAHQLAEAAAEPVELEILEGTGHTFGAQHPFRGPTPALTQVFNRTQAWFRRHL